MTRLREAYQYNNIDEFQRILRDRQLRTTIMNDQFIKENIDSLLKLIRTQVLVKLIKPYTRYFFSDLSPINYRSLDFHDFIYPTSSR